MTDEATIDSSSQPVAFAPLGEMLLAARNVKKLTQKDVSNNLRISIKQISALENNDFSALPEAMITRGFIRNYARLLDLDADPLLDSYRARVPGKSPSALSVQSSMYQVMSGKDSQPWLKYILGSILVLLFLLAWIFYIDYMPKPVKPSVGKPSEVVDATPPSTEMPLPEIALPAAERQAGTDTPVVTDPAALAATEPTPPLNVTPASPAEANSTQTNPPAIISPVTANPVGVKPAVVSPATTLVNPAATNNTNTMTPLTATPAAPAVTSSKALSFSVNEKTWINITDKSGKVVYERILPAGGSDSLNGEPPFNVVVGNAKATTLSYKGQAVDLVTGTTENNVARIKLE
ncbi:MAG TPA: RodZ domain-containing protein [Methylotenera sp.]|nr:RodZ domain-containing protein [Methylotenera sp.]